MELEAIVEALLGKLDEVAHMDGGVFACQLHANGALRRDENGDFLTRRLVGRSIKISHDYSPSNNIACTYMYEILAVVPYSLGKSPQYSCAERLPSMATLR